MTWRQAGSSFLVLLIGAALGACLAFWGCQHLMVNEHKFWNKACEQRVTTACFVSTP